MQGKIVKGIAGFYYVHVVESGVYECKAKGIFRKDGVKPLVGDNVEIEVLDEEEKKGNIREILTRKNELIRPAVANIDQALVVFAVTKPKPHFNLLDRFLVMMEQKKIPVILCFNKSDIAKESDISKMEEIYRSCGYPVFFTSAKEGWKIEEVKDSARENDCSCRPVGCREVVAYQSSAVGSNDGNREYQQEDRQRKAYDETFRTFSFGRR